MRLAIAVVAMFLAACGSEDPRCGFTRSTAWSGGAARVELSDAAGVAAICDVPGGVPAHATCADGAGSPVFVATACLERLPTDAPPR